MSNEKYLTLVFRVPLSDTVRAILESTAWTAASWSHVLHDRDAANKRAEKLLLKVTEIEGERDELERRLRAAEGAAVSDLADLERDCCGTFKGSLHRKTCEQYRCKKGGE